MAEHANSTPPPTGEGLLHRVRAFVARFRRNDEPGSGLPDPTTSPFQHRDVVIGEGTKAVDTARLDDQVQLSLHHSDLFFWRIGFLDGQRGVIKARAHALAHDKAREFKNDLENIYKQKIDSLKYKREYTRDEKDRFIDENDTCRKNRLRLEDGYRRHPRPYSWFLGSAYLIAAILLVLADIPLAVSLTGIAFNFPIARKSTDLGNFFANSWEAVLISLGIALFATFIKIYWDEFVGRPKELLITDFKDIQDVEENETEAIRILVRKRSYAKTAVLLLTVVTLIVLGLLRNAAEPEKRAATPSNSNVHESVRSGSTVSAEPSTGSGGEGSETERPRSVFYAPAFILITLMFPIIGGICASLGFSYIENRWALARARASSRRSGKALEKAQERHRSTIQELSNWEIRLQQVTPDAYEATLRQLFVSTYDHGYQRGWLEPVHQDGDDLFGMARLFRHRLVAREMLDAQWRQQPGAGNWEPGDIGGDSALSGDGSAL